MAGRLATSLRRNAFYKGLLGPSTGWRRVFVALVVGRAVRSIWKREPKVAAIEVLAPGQSVEVRALAPQRRRKR